MHADTFHPTVKAWLYLNETASEALPFVYIPGSHKLTPERVAWERAMSLAAPGSSDPDTRQGSFRLKAADAAAMGLPEARILHVPPNTLIVADTFGFHARGGSSAPSTRVEIWAVGRLGRRSLIMVHFEPEIRLFASHFMQFLHRRL